MRNNFFLNLTNVDECVLGWNLRPQKRIFAIRKRKRQQCYDKSYLLRILQGIFPTRRDHHVSFHVSFDTIIWTFWSAEAIVRNVRVDREANASKRSQKRFMEIGKERKRPLLLSLSLSLSLVSRSRYIGASKNGSIRKAKRGRKITRAINVMKTMTYSSFHERIAYSPILLSLFLLNSPVSRTLATAIQFKSPRLSKFHSRVHTPEDP